LGAEAELWMEDEKYIVNNSFIIYVPKGLRHCPLILRNLKTPVFHFDLQLTTSDFKAVPVDAPPEAKMAELKYEKYIIKGGLPSFASGARSGKFDAKVARPKLHPVMALTKHASEGAVIVICSWMWAGEDPGVQGAHTHPYDEIIGFAGTNPNDLHDLGAEAELWMEDEKYIINNSFFVYVPKGVKHCPLIIRDIKSPVLHFDVQLTTGEFSETAV
jgi:mannose-6-phosphate isomerase-like protein (cupin superfamily)